MIYKYIALADIHWGAMDSKEMYNNLQQVLSFIKYMKDKIDFVVICGDYFEYRLQLNSKTALRAVQWFDELYNCCKQNCVKKLRMLKGTAEHDNDQLEIFRATYESKDDDFFKLFNKTTSEYLFDDLKVVYCPDETINIDDYYDMYWDQFFPNPDIGFFHGNWDTILPKIEYDRIQNHHLNKIIYQYGKFSRMIKGPMISGHWHIAQNTRSMYYIGSFDRWKFGEEEPKGFIFGAYNTETNQYFIHRVNNPLAKIYRTIIIADDHVRTPMDFSLFSSEIKKILQANPEIRLSIQYLISDPSDEVFNNFNVFSKTFANNRQVKIDYKDLVKREEKKYKKKEVLMEAEKYQYVFSKDYKNIPEIIQKFIKDKKNEDLSIEQIGKYIGKYLNR